MDYPEASGRLLGAIQYLAIVRNSSNNELLPHAVDMVIDTEKEVREALESKNKTIMEALDEKIKELAR